MNPIIGLPGIKTERSTKLRKLLYTDKGSHLIPQFFTIDGTNSRDPSNTGDVGVLQAGLILGQITSGKKLAPAIIGLSSGALTNTGTTLSSSAAVATELNRRIGASGTFKLTGPPTAAGTVRTLTVTYSAVNTTTGDITITATGVNEVQTVVFGAAATGGTFKIGFTVGGAVLYTDTIAWSATDATFLSNMNAAIDNLLGAGLVVATARSAIDTDLGFVLTFSGAGYTDLAQTLVEIDAAALTSVSTVTVTRTTAAVDGRFVTASFIQPTDGSETPKLLIPDSYGIPLVDQDGTFQDNNVSELLVGGFINTGQLINYPADASLKAWVKSQLRAVGYAYLFTDDFGL